MQLQNRVESLLEEAHIKLFSFVSSLLGVSARRTLKAVADGETNQETLAALADRKLRATQERLRDALGPCSERDPKLGRDVTIKVQAFAGESDGNCNWCFRLA